jgi:hypothetical protein
MKKLFCCTLLVASACSKKDAPPAYSDFTPIAGQFTVVESGVFRKSGRDTTAVLANLQLRILPSTSNANQDEYTFRGNLDARETVDIHFAAPKTQSHSGSWSGLQVNTYTHYNGQSANTQGNDPNGGKLSASGNAFTASFDVAGLRGSLK